MKPEAILGILIAVLVMAGLGYLLVSKTPDTVTDSTSGNPSATTTATNSPVNLLIANLKSLSVTPEKPNVKASSAPGTPYVEIANPSGFVNSGPITVKEFIGKKVILIDFMTYSCINCQRTFPYVTAWYNKYKDQGLIVIGIHTPEFAFEKDIKNVREAMQRFGITYPVVLDNDYGTWNAFANSYWPRKYLIDIHGNIVYDHAGEGAYDTTEAKIRELLKERADFLKEGVTLGGTTSVQGTVSQARSPETYFGASRNEFLVNGVAGRAGSQDLTIPDNLTANKLYLGGNWNFDLEFAKPTAGSVVKYRYTAGEVYLVAKGSPTTSVEVWQDAVRVSGEAGADVQNGTVNVAESRLYKLIKNAKPGEHVLELRVKGPGAELYAFTFG